MARRRYDFDVVLAGEAGGGREGAKALRACIDVLILRGLRVAILPPAEADAPVHGALADTARRGSVTLLEGDAAAAVVWCRLTVVAGVPGLDMLATACGLRAEATLLLVSAEDVASLRTDAARAILGCVAEDQVWCPADPAVRARLAGAGLGRLLDAEDWPLVMGSASRRLPRRAADGRRVVLGQVVGRGLGRPVADLAAAVARHPRAGELDRRLLLAVGTPDDDLGGCKEAGWRVVPGDAASLRRFLSRLDFLVAQPDEKSPDAVPRPVLEAMAAGRVVILSPVFKRLLGDGLAYRTPEQVVDTARYLSAEPAFYARYVAAQDRLLEPHAPERLWRRLEAHLGPSRTSAAAKPAGTPTMPPIRRRVAFYPTNGIGLGHVTRLLAVARRLDSGLEPVFFTPCHALRVVENAGYRTEYVSEPAYDGTAHADNARAAAPSLARAFRHHGVEAVVFDGNVPREGLILAAAERDLPFVWVRRGMWREDPSLARFLELARHCDAVIEPEEAAATADAGVTAGARDGAIRVPPIMLLDRGEPLKRAEARAALGLPGEGPCALVQLGSGNNRNTEALLDPVLAGARRLGVRVLVAEWLIAERPVRRQDARYLSAFPNARYLHAFDFAVTAAGYNSFHELLHHGLPCVLLPNDDQRVDDQRARAAFAEAQGAGVCVPAGGEAQVGRYMEILLDRSLRRLMARRARELCPTNGARAAAAAVEAVLARG